MRILLTVSLLAHFASPALAQEVSRQKQVDNAAEDFETKRAKALEQREQATGLRSLEGSGFLIQAQNLQFETLPGVVLAPKDRQLVKVAPLQTLKSGFVLYQQNALEAAPSGLKVSTHNGETLYPAVRETKSGQIFYLSGKLRLRSNQEASIQGFAKREGLELSFFDPRLNLAIVTAKPGSDLKVLLEKALKEFGQAKAELDLNGPPQSHN